MTDPPGVSFVVTVYNKESFLEATLLSILRQDGSFEREFIVIDDGSADRSLEIAGDLVGTLPNGTVIRQANSGPAHALNAAVAAAGLPVIKPVDGDDMLTPDATVRLLKGLDDPRVGLVRGVARPIPHAGAPLRIERDSENPVFRIIDDPLPTAIRHSMAGCSEVMFRRRAFMECGGCDPSVFVQDYSLMWRLAVHNAFAFSDDIVVFAPPAYESSLIHNHLQVQHDRNAALCGMLRDFPDLPHAVKRIAVNRAAGRAWKWARRHNGTPLGMDRTFWLWLASYLPWLPDYRRCLAATLVPFTRTGPIRRPDGSA
jgi:glycosyltransferase involved in cell wall biosynthesis